ncbi:MAG: hypothetical protein OHK0028_24220 [Deltaproteobacteria bacterium]
MSHRARVRENPPRMAKRVGFRNVAAHDYQALNLRIVQAIVTGHLGDSLPFARWALWGKGK